MAQTVNSYAKLTAPNIFMCNEDVVFHLEVSSDFAGCHAELVIDNYEISSLDESGRVINTYTGTTVWNYHIGGIGGVYYCDFTVPANTLAKYEGVAYSGTGATTPLARVNLYKLGVKAFESNTTTVSFIIANPDIPFIYVGTETPAPIDPDPISATGSEFDVPLQVDVYTFCLGDETQLFVNSYHVTLYDSNKNQIFQSDEMYDWNNEIYYRQMYSLKNLKDKTTYFVDFTVELVGKSSFTSLKRQLDVAYRSHTYDPDYLLLNNNPYNGSVEITGLLSEGVTSCIVSRSVKGTNHWIDLFTRNITSGVVNVADYLARPNIAYVYRIISTKDGAVVDEFYNEITHTVEGVCIAEQNVSYCTSVNVQRFPIEKNERVALIETLDKQYPIGIVNNSANYYSGSVSGLFTQRNSCEYNLIDTLPYSFELLDFLNNGKPKLLKFYDGNCWLVNVTGSPSVSSEDDIDDTVTVSFNWFETADVKDENNLRKVGLIV